MAPPTSASALCRQNLLVYEADQPRDEDGLPGTRYQLYVGVVTSSLQMSNPVNRHLSDFSGGRVVEPDLNLTFTKPTSNKMPVVFDALPNELLLEIVIRISFGKGDFRTLSLVNWRLRDLIKTHRIDIIQRVAKIQFPVAARAASLHPLAYVPTVEWLEHLLNDTRDVNDFMKIIRDIFGSSLVEKQLLAQSPLTLFISERWLETGLHLFRGLRVEYWRSLPGTGGTDYEGLVELSLSALSPVDCLAMRHVSKIILNIINLTLDGKMMISHSFVYLAQFSIRKQITERALIGAIERELSSSQSHYYDLKEILAYGGRDAETSLADGDDRAHYRTSLQRLGFLARRSMTNFSGNALHLPQRLRFESAQREQHLTWKISEMYRDWNAISTGERESIMQEFGINGSDEDHALRRVEEYLLIDRNIDGLTGYDNWLLDRCLTSSTP